MIIITLFSPMLTILINRVIFKINIIYFKLIQFWKIKHIKRVTYKKIFQVFACFKIELNLLFKNLEINVLVNNRLEEYFWCSISCKIKCNHYLYIQFLRHDSMFDLSQIKNFQQFLTLLKFLLNIKDIKNFFI
jgi:hypothetical protein